MVTGPHGPRSCLPLRSGSGCLPPAHGRHTVLLHQVGSAGLPAGTQDAGPQQTQQAGETECASERGSGSSALRDGSPVHCRVTARPEAQPSLRNKRGACGKCRRVSPFPVLGSKKHGLYSRAILVRIFLKNARE